MNNLLTHSFSQSIIPKTLDVQKNKIEAFPYFSIENRLLFESMKNELNRFNSFRDKWPVDFISIDDLVKSGFFYLLSDDKVQCAFCKLILVKWEEADKPHELHLKFSPDCCFIKKSKNMHNQETVKRTDASFFPDLLHNPSNLQRAKIPRMSDVKKRLSTYKEWSFSLISSEKLAVSGLFYTGVDDVVTCFSCGISLRDWEPCDEPTIKHSQLYSNCIFLHFVLLGSHPRKKISRSPVSFTQPLKISVSEVMNSKVVKEAKEIFPPQLVEEVISQHVLDNGGSFSSVHQLCDKILDYEEKKLNILKNTSKKNECSSILSNPGYSTNGGSEDASLTEVLLCKICFSSERRITFQPCGHLISCESCGQRINTCPICRQSVKNRIKTYLS